MYDEAVTVSAGKKRKLAAASISPPSAKIPRNISTTRSITSDLNNFSYSNLMKQMAMKYNNGGNDSDKRYYT